MKRRDWIKKISILLLEIVIYDQCLEGKANCVQIQKKKIYGTVEGEKGNHIANAKIRLTNTKTGKIFLTETNLEGKFSIEDVTKGDYVLIVEVVGYETQVRRAVKFRQNIPKFERIIFPDLSEETFKQAIEQQEEANLLVEVISPESFYVLKPSDSNPDERSDFQFLIGVSEKIEKDLAVVILGKSFNVSSDSKRKDIVSKLNLLLTNFGFKKIIFHQSYYYGFEIILP